MFVEPVTSPPYIDRSKTADTYVAGAMSRRQEWTSREEAKRLLLKSPFFAAWHPDALDLYIECALTPVSASDPSKGVKLKTDCVQVR
jgi:hypothetical protein